MFADQRQRAPFPLDTFAMNNDLLATQPQRHPPNSRAGYHRTGSLGELKMMQRSPIAVSAESLTSPLSNGHSQRASTHSPTTQRRSSNSPSTSRRNSPPKGGNSKVKKGNICFCCKTTTTPLWREGRKGTRLCNACGIRWVKYLIQCNVCNYVPRKAEAKGIDCPKCGTKLPPPEPSTGRRQAPPALKGLENAKVMDKHRGNVPLSAGPLSAFSTGSPLSAGQYSPGPLTSPLSHHQLLSPQLQSPLPSPLCNNVVNLSLS